MFSSLSSMLRRNITQLAQEKITLTYLGKGHLLKSRLSLKALLADDGRMSAISVPVRCLSLPIWVRNLLKGWLFSKSVFNKWRTHARILDPHTRFLS
jgi:hypothetical protein